MKKILVTGGMGFIGKALTKKLTKSGYSVNITSRKKTINSSETITIFNTGEINEKTKWDKALSKVDCVIHCAAITNSMNKPDEELIESFRKVNLEGTINLAKQSVSMGVKRLIFLSTIKVNGEKTFDKLSFKNNDDPNPRDAYSNSKWKAEQELYKISKSTKLEVVIIRLPLVYGLEAKGNLMRLMQLIKSNIPLPLSMVHNQRSMIGIDNLVDLLIQCIDHSDAHGKTFLASDGEDLSAPQLIKLIASSMGQKVHLFPIPLFILKLFGYIFGKQKEINRLIGSLRVDNSFTKKTLNWTPSISVKEGIRRMVQGK